LKIIALHKESAELPKFTAFAEKQGGLFFKPQWTAIYDPQHLQLCLIVNNNGDAIGCFQYFKFSKAIFNMVITPPFTPNIGLCFVNPAESVVGKNSFSKEILTAVADYFDQLKSDLTDLALPAHVMDTQPFTWRGFQSSLRYSYWLDLSQTEEELWNKLSSEKRKSINRAQKENIQTELVTDRQEVYQLILASLSRHHVLKNKSIIQKIVLNPDLANHSFAFLAKEKTIPTSATFCTVSGDTAVYLFGGTADPSGNNGSGVSCMWQSILHAKKLGLAKFDFEGSMQPGIERYFREFGGNLVPYAAIEAKRPVLRALLNMRKK
jgi:hypothetical protein